MPIVNGQFQSTSLGSPQAAQQAVFGDYSKKDMNDYSTAAYNYLIHQQDQAFALDAWRLQNEYNSPAAQMARYKAAGLNPNLIYSQQQAGAGFSAPSGTSFNPKNTQQRNFANAMSVVQQIQALTNSAANVADTISQTSLRKSQADVNYANVGLIGAKEEGVKMQNELQAYLAGFNSGRYVSGDTTKVIPYAKMYESQIEAQQAKVEQMRAAISMIPDEQARKRALTELEKYRLDIMKGQNDAILNIHTGYNGLDGFLKMLSYFLLNQSVSFSHKF